MSRDSQPPARSTSIQVVDSVSLRHEVEVDDSDESGPVEQDFVVSQVPMHDLRQLPGYQRLVSRPHLVDVRDHIVGEPAQGFIPHERIRSAPSRVAAAASAAKTWFACGAVRVADGKLAARGASCTRARAPKPRRTSGSVLIRVSQATKRSSSASRQPDSRTAGQPDDGLGGRPGHRSNGRDAGSAIAVRAACSASSRSQDFVPR